MIKIKESFFQSIEFNDLIETSRSQKKNNCGESMKKKTEYKNTACDSSEPPAYHQISPLKNHLYLEETNNDENELYHNKPVCTRSDREKRKLRNVKKTMSPLFKLDQKENDSMRKVCQNSSGYFNDEPSCDHDNWKSMSLPNGKVYLIKFDLITLVLAEFFVG